MKSRAKIASWTTWSTPHFRRSSLIHGKKDQKNLSGFYRKQHCDMDLALDTFSGWVNDCFAFDSHVNSCFAFDKHERESVQGSFDLPRRGDYDKFLPIIYHPDRATGYKRWFFFFFLNHHQPKEKNYHLNILNELRACPQKIPSTHNIS